MFSHCSNSLAGLLIGLVICQSASVEWVRIKKDTRDISSDKFKPLQPSSKNENEAPMTVNNDTNYHSDFQEHSTAQAHAKVAPWEGNNEDRSWPPTSRFPAPSRFNYPERLPFPADRFITPNSGSSFETRVDPFVGGHRISGPSRLGQTVFGESGFSGPMPLSIHTGQRLSTSSGFFNPINNFGESGFGGDSANNYYRSESYRYSSDGSGPPHVQQSVYDSRFGNDLSNRKF
ncbi:uncharacterized protein LOC111592575 [Drosophila hydei]|uniref:Uncharacterized protein LOC111592575 n=1 Tax=Drosophila hydei TaxID=7224 RepID=A0A6J1L8W4_DROHY|nr:uncharacterized protein LOC111592575 [Drosophila hydei]